jgi:hypothetical protein
MEVSDCVDAALTLALSLDRERDRIFTLGVESEREVIRFFEDLSTPC